MKEPPEVLRLSALLSEPCRKLDRLDVTHSDATHCKKDKAVYMHANPDYYSDFTQCVPRNRRIMCLHEYNHPKTTVYIIRQ